MEERCDVLRKGNTEFQKLGDVMMLMIKKLTIYRSILFFCIFDR